MNHWFKPIWVISQMTFREMIRDKIMVIFAIFFLVSLFLSQLMSKLVIMEVYKVILDFTLAGFSLFGQLLALFLGVSLVFKEIEKKTIWVILTKPISRLSFLLGKFLGLSMVLIVFSLIFGVIAAINCLRVNNEILIGVSQAILLHLVETMVLLSICMMLSTVTKPLLGLFSALGLFIVGHTISYINIFLKDIDDLVLLKEFLSYIKIGFNLELFNIRSDIVFQHSIEWADVGYRSLYGLALSVFFLMMALLFFERRDF